MKHTCHATFCKANVPPKMFMCKRHWYMVPRDLRAAIWAAYVPGQEVRKDPTPEYLDTAIEAIAVVAAKEGHGQAGGDRAEPRGDVAQPDSNRTRGNPQNATKARRPTRRVGG